MTSLIVARGQTAAPNLIKNGSFVGHASGWYQARDGSIVSWASDVTRSPGSGSLSLTGPAGLAWKTEYRPGGVHAISLQGATALDITTSAMTEGPGGAISWHLSFFSSAVTSGASFISTITNNDSNAVFEDTWADIGWRGIAVPEGATHVRVLLDASQLESGQDLIFLDDVYVGPLLAFPVAPIALTGNRVSNPDFEHEITPWFPSGTATLTRDTDNPMGGSYSLKVQTPGVDQWEGMYYASVNDLVVVSGESLRASFTVRGSGDLAFVIYGGDWPPIELWSDTLTSEPQEVSVDFTVPAGHWWGQPYFMTPDPTTAAITFWVDDIYIGTAP